MIVLYIYIYSIYYILVYIQHNVDVSLETGTISPEILSHPPPVSLHIYTVNRRRMSRILDTLFSNLDSCTRLAYCGTFPQHLTGQCRYSALKHAVVPYFVSFHRTIYIH